MSTLSERLAVLGVVNPADQGTTAASTAWVHVGGYNRFIGLVIGGALTGTLDAKFEQATSSGGAGVKDVTGKAITQIADTADNKQASINIRQDQLDIAGGFEYIRLTITPTGGTTNLAAGLLLGGDARYSPPTSAASHVETIL